MKASACGCVAKMLYEGSFIHAGVRHNRGMGTALGMAR
jgi:hypothetical protein